MIRVATVLLALAVAPVAMAQDVPAGLRDAVAAHTAGDVNAEASALLDTLGNARLAGSHGAAWAMLGDLLATQNLPVAAGMAYGQALATGPAAMAPRLAGALATVQSTGDLSALGAGALAGGIDALASTPERSELAVLGARTAIQSGDYDAAIALTDLVAMDHPAVVEARTLRGIALSNKEAYGDALASLLIAEAAATDTEDHDWVSLNLARAYYGADNPLRAIEHYVQVSRGSELWLDAHWERAWAHFRVDDMQGTLSLLRAFQTPYLEDVYLAEGDALRIYALFLMCKFPTAKSELDAFTARYRPLLAALDQSLTSAQDDASYFESLRAHRDGAAASLPEPVYDQFDGDDRMARSLAVTEAGDAELATLRSRGADWTDGVTTPVQAHLDALRTQEGARIVGQARAMQTELRTWLESADLTRLDILDYERRLLEQAAITGEVNLGDRLGDLRGLRNRRGTRVWPASSEVWADEVGYESVRTRSDCREDLL